MAYYITRNDDCDAYVSIPGPIPEDHVDGIVEITEEEYNAAIRQIMARQGEVFE